MARARWHFAAPAAPSAQANFAPSTDAAHRPLVRVQALGAASILVGAERVDPSSDTMFALLLRIVYAPGHAVPRETLLRCMWPGHTDARKRANLRQALYKLRLLGVEAGLAGDMVMLDPAQVAPVFSLQRTVGRFDEDVTRGDEPFGAFLPGYSTGWKEYEEWLNGLREQVHADVRRILVLQLSARRERADWTGADALARWLLQFDPLNEEATFTVAECMAINGSKVEAIALLDRYIGELGPNAGELRLSATLLRRRITESHRKERARGRGSAVDRHFIGREELMAELTLEMRRAKWGDGSATVLVGPPGMGKTRVGHELSTVAGIEGFRVVRVECRQSEQRRPFAFCLDLVAELMELPGAMACSPESMAVLRRMVSERAPAGGAHVELPESVSMTTAADQQPLPLPSIVRRSIVELVRNVCYEKTMLLVAEDVHWLDELSASALVDMVRAVPDCNLFLLGTARTVTTESLAEVVTAGMVMRVLPPLSHESARRLTACICADLGTSCDEALSEWFIRSSEGTPLFLRGLVTHWVDTGVAGGVPPTLAALVDQRLSVLSADALRTIQAAALLGRHAAVTTITELLEFPVIRMLGAVEELTDAGTYSSGNADVMVFHELITRAALERLSAPSTRLLHARAASVLQTARFDGDEAVPVDIVAHLAKAGDVAGLASYAVRAAGRYLYRGFPHRALAVCELASGQGLPGEALAELERIEVAALYSAGQHARLMEMLSQSMQKQRADRTWDERNADEVLHLIDSTRHTPIVGDSEELAARAVLLAECPRLSPETRLNAAMVALRIATNSADIRTARRAFSAGNVAASRADEVDLARNELDMFYHTAFGDAGVARNAALWLATQLHRYDNRTIRLAMQSSVCYALRVGGELHIAYELYSRTYDEASSLGMVAIAALLAWNASLIALDLFEDADLAEQWLNRPECKLPEIEKQHAGIVIQENWVRLAIVRKQPDVARDRLSLIAETNIDKNIPQRAAYFLAIQIGTAILNTNRRALEGHVEEALAVASHLSRMVGQDFFVHQVVTGLLELGRRDEAVSVLQDYFRLSRRKDSAVPRYLQEDLHECELIRENERI